MRCPNQGTWVAKVICLWLVTLAKIDHLHATSTVMSTRSICQKEIAGCFSMIPFQEESTESQGFDSSSSVILQSGALFHVINFPSWYCSTSLRSSISSRTLIRRRNLGKLIIKLMAFAIIVNFLTTILKREEKAIKSGSYWDSTAFTIPIKPFFPGYGVTQQNWTHLIGWKPVLELGPRFCGSVPNQVFAFVF